MILLIPNNSSALRLLDDCYIILNITQATYHITLNCYLISRRVGTNDYLGQIAQFLLQVLDALTALRDYILLVAMKLLRIMRQVPLIVSDHRPSVRMLRRDKITDPPQEPLFKALQSTIKLRDGNVLVLDPLHSYELNRLHGNVDIGTLMLILGTCSRVTIQNLWIR